MPDRGGQREDALPDAGTDSVDAAPAVQLEVELPFQDVEDRFDELADGFEQVLTGLAWRWLSASTAGAVSTRAPDA